VQTPRSSGGSRGSHFGVIPSPRALGLLRPILNDDEIDPSQLVDQSAQPHDVGAVEVRGIIEITELLPAVALVHPVHVVIGVRRAFGWPPAVTQA